jgi:hypothetical protein
VTGGCISSIVEMKSVRVLFLTETSVCGPELALLAKLPKLEIVDLGNTPTSDSDLPYLKQIPGSVFLWFNPTQLSNAAAGQLPNAIIRKSQGSPKATTGDSE